MHLSDTIGNSARFKRIVRGNVRKKDNLKKYISRDELIGKQGNEKIRIPVPIIHIPRFRYGKNMGGVAQGEGEIGDVIDPHHSGRPGAEGSDDPDSGEMDVEISMSELEEILMEELGLPYLEPKGEQNIYTQKPIYKSIAEHGVQRHFKRTYKEALKRTVASGDYQPGDAVIPIRRDFRYRAATYQPDVQSSAAILYLLDASPSMTDEYLRRCRLTNFWTERAIARQHDYVEGRHIIHSTRAYEVEKSIFYKKKLLGGTCVSSAFQKSIEIIKKDYPPKEWNIYIFYYSDGGNFEEDNDKALALLGNMLLPAINMFCYGECSSGKELFMYEMAKRFNLNSNKGSDIPRKKIRTSHLMDDYDILETLRTFLTKDNLPFYQTR